MRAFWCLYTEPPIWKIYSGRELKCAKEYIAIIFQVVTLYLTD